MMQVRTTLKAFPRKGIGVVLCEPVARGQLVWRFDSRIDRVYSRQELLSLPDLQQEQIRLYATYNRLFDVWVLCGDHGRFFNHSRNPTTISQGGSFGDDRAARDLMPGTELTSNYDMIGDSTAEDIAERRSWLE